MVMGVVYWTLMIGFITGALAKIFYRRMKQGELFMTMTIGLIGSVFGGWLGSKLGLYAYASLDGLVGSLIGAVVFVVIYCLYFKRKTSRLSH